VRFSRVAASMGYAEFCCTANQRAVVNRKGIRSWRTKELRLADAGRTALAHAFYGVPDKASMRVAKTLKGPRRDCLSATRVEP